MKRLIVILILSVVVASCEDKIDLDVPEGPVKVVVDGIINNIDSIQTITLSRTSAYFESSPTPRITNAVVFVTTSKGDTIYFNHDTNVDGNYNANYTANDSTVDYQLNVLVDGKQYISFSEKLNRVAPVDTFRQSDEFFPEAGDFRQAGYAGLLTTKEYKGPGDFYRWIIWVNGEKLIDPFNLIVTDDRLVDGNDIVDWDIVYELLPGDVVYVQQMSISERAFHYWSLIADQITRFGGPFDTPPAPIEGNMYNINDPDDKVLGFFGVSKIQEARLVVK